MTETATTTPRRRTRPRKSERAQRTAGGRSVSGDLAFLGLPEIVQALSLGLKTACLSVECGKREGKIWFEQGSALHAEAGELRGEIAFYEILRWKRGRFSIGKGRPAKDRTLDGDALYLLMEGSRRIDESAGGKGDALARPESAEAGTVELTRDMRKEIDSLLLDLAAERVGRTEMRPTGAGRTPEPRGAATDVSRAAEPSTAAAIAAEAAAARTSAAGATGTPTLAARTSAAKKTAAGATTPRPAIVAEARATEARRPEVAAVSPLAEVLALRQALGGC